MHSTAPINHPQTHHNLPTHRISPAKESFDFNLEITPQSTPNITDIRFGQLQKNKSTSLKQISPWKNLPAFSLRKTISTIKKNTFHLEYGIKESEVEQLSP